MLDSENRILEDYKALTPDLHKWGAYVDCVLKKELMSRFEDKNAIQIPPSYRLKDEKSFLYKALYRRKSYVNPLLDIEDKVGTRVVVLKSLDIQLAYDLICKSDAWESKTTKSIDQVVEDDPKKFDYQSLHMVVSPKDDNSDYDKAIRPLLTCEIQIRTLLQHAFAEISHDSSYKGPYKNDKDVIRRLSKSMALMEATDDYFCDIFDLMRSEERIYRNYMNDLRFLYMELNASFKDSDVDFFITDAVFELLDLILINQSDLSVYVEKEKDKLIKIIRKNHEVFFSQPVFILANYYFTYHRAFLDENWPLSRDSLALIYRVNGTSFGNF